MFLLFYIFMPLLFIFLKHPLSMGLTLIIHTVITSMVMNFMALNFWYSYIIMLIMIGGMLIIFIYMTSIASNEKFKFNMFMLTLLFFPFTIYYLLKNVMKEEFLSMETLKKFSNQEFSISMMKFIDFPFILLNMFMVIFLFIILVIAVKISCKSEGPLRQMFN